LHDKIQQFGQWSEKFGCHRVNLIFITQCCHWLNVFTCTISSYTLHRTCLCLLAHTTVIIIPHFEKLFTKLVYSKQKPLITYIVQIYLCLNMVVQIQYRLLLHMHIAGLGLDPSTFCMFQTSAFTGFSLFTGP